MLNGIKTSRICSLATALSLTLLVTGNVQALNLTEEDYELKLLGKFVFFDKISRPRIEMACVTCHEPTAGWAGPDSDVNAQQVVMEGAVDNRFGGLKPPSNAYASFIAPFGSCDGFAGPVPCGGNFWDGRAEGRGADLGGAVHPAGATKHIGEEVFYKPGGKIIKTVLGYSKYFSSISDQALNPMPNPVEQNIDRQKVCDHVAESKYAKLYKLAWGVEIKCNESLVSVTAGDVVEETNFDISFKRLMLAVGAYQHSADVNSFSSKRDNALRAELACLEGVDTGACDDGSTGEFPLAGLSEQENYGHDLFYDSRSDLNPTRKRARCRICHQSGNRQGTTPEETYADDEFHHIGVPANPDIPGDIGVNPGLMGHTGDPDDIGEFKTPTLRNIDLRPDASFVKAYTHNGWFKSMKSIVHFYNTSNLGNCVIAEDDNGCTDGGELAVSETTAAAFGITRCPEEIQTESDALANNCWPARETEEKAVAFGVGDLRLDRDDENAIVAYLKTLSDTHVVLPPTDQDLIDLGIKLR